MWTHGPHRQSGQRPRLPDANGGVLRQLPVHQPESEFVPLPCSIFAKLTWKMLKPLQSNRNQPNGSNYSRRFRLPLS